jgi:hypothetical protein
MFLTAAIISSLAALLGVLLTALTLPGIWFMCLVALICKIWQPGLYEWWTIIVVFALAALAEVAEGLSSAAGSAKAGGTRAGLIGSIIGSIAGLLAGTVLIPLPILGSIIGGIIGAGLGAFGAERVVSRRTWGDSWRSGRGAAVGRALSTVIKTAFAALAATVLIFGAFFN